MLKVFVSCILLAFEAKVGSIMPEAIKKLRFSFKAGICLLLVCAFIFVPWAFTQKNKAYEKADERLLRRRDKIKSDNTSRLQEVDAFYSDLRWEALDDFASQYEWNSDDGDSDYSFYHIDSSGAKVYTIIEDNDALPSSDYIDDGSGLTEPSQNEEPEAYYDDDGVLRYPDGEKVPEFLYLDENGRLAIDEAYIYDFTDDSFDDDFDYFYGIIDEDGDSYQINNLDLNGYRFQERMGYDEALDMFTTIGPPEPENEMSRENETLMKAVTEMEPVAETTGSIHGYRYATFFVQGVAYVKYPTPENEESYVRILDLSDIESAKAEIHAEGSLDYRVLHVIIFEDTEPFLRQWRLDMLKNGGMLVLLCGMVFLALFLYEKRTEALERQRLMEEEHPEETENKEESSPEVPFEESISAETARQLIAQIGLAEQSMGPNPFLEKLRDDINERSGKKEKEQEP